MPSGNYSSELARVAEVDQPFLDRLYSSESATQWQAVNDIRNLIVGNRRQKANFIIIGAVPRLVYIIKSSECPAEIRRDCITLLTSLAKGSHDNVISLCDYGACEAILSVLLSSQNQQVIQASLRCARAIIVSSSGNGVKHRRTIKNEGFILNQFENEKIVARLVEILEMDSPPLKKAAFEILTRIASATAKSMILDSAGAKLVHHLMKTLQKMSHDLALIVSATKCLATLLDGSDLAKNFVLLNSGNDQLQRVLHSYLQLKETNPSDPSHQHNDEVRISVCHCLVSILSVRFRLEDALHVMRVLTLLCAPECDPEIRIQSAEILSALLVQNAQLQSAAFYSNQLPKKIEKYFQLPTASDAGDVSSVQNFTRELNAFMRLRYAGLLLLAALTATDERLRTVLLHPTKPPDIFKETAIIQQSWIMCRLSEALSENQDPNDQDARRVLLGGLKCLRSISRSDQHLRTTLFDAEIYDSFTRLYQRHRDDEELMHEIIPIVANFMLDFCPQKDELYQLAGKDLVDFIKNPRDGEYTTYSLSALINLTYSNSTNRFKDILLQQLSIEDLRDCLERLADESDLANVGKVFALLRNLVDGNNLLVESRGDELMQIVETYVKWDDPFPLSVRSQLNHLLINLSNLPIGVAKICANGQLLRNIVLIFSDENDLHLKTQSSTIILNLLRNSDEKFPTRQKLLREAGVLKIIQNAPTNGSSKFNKLNENVQSILKRLGEMF
jgi:hypothetical protein